jgi:RNA polymerase Rpb8
MELTLDYNSEIFPLNVGQDVALALASSLTRGPAASQDATDEEDRDRDVWRPDSKGRRGLEDDYGYVMHGRVYRFDPGTGEVVYVPLVLICLTLIDAPYILSGLHTHHSVGFSCL